MQRLVYRIASPHFFPPVHRLEVVEPDFHHFVSVRLGEIGFIGECSGFRGWWGLGMMRRRNRVEGGFEHKGEIVCGRCGGCSIRCKGEGDALVGQGREVKRERTEYVSLRSEARASEGVDI